MHLDQVSVSKVESFIDRNVASMPIIDDSDSSVHVKDIIVSKENDEWVVTRVTQLARFDYKSWAVAYAVALMNDNFSTCQYLVDANQRLNKLQADRVLYRYHQKVAEEKHNDLKLNILECRLNRVDYDISELVLDAHQVMRYQGFV